MLPLVVAAGLFLLTAMTLLWLLSLKLRDTSIVDLFWGFGFVAVYWIGFILVHSGIIASQPVSTRQLLVGFLLTIWGLRLTLHILFRNWGHGEDFRYALWRGEAGQAWWWRSYFKVFLLQGFILWLVSWPLLAVLAGRSSPSLGLLDLLAVLVWGIGFFFEAVGDYQLRSFKNKPTNKGQLLTSGLWRYTRHPNYFGDALVWWGIYLFAAASGAWLTIFSPFIMTFLLLRVSGVAMLERTLRETKPGYATYIARTNAFFPGWPKDINDTEIENEVPA
jgi:steroid 5-alpha reductase family enzyme